MNSCISHRSTTAENHFKHQRIGQLIHSDMYNMLMNSVRALKGFLLF